MRRNAPVRPRFNPDFLIGPGLVAVLVLLSLGTFLQSRWLVQLPSMLFFGLVIWAKASDALPAALLLLFLYVGVQFLPDFVWTLPTVGFLLPLALAFVFTYPSAAARQEWRWARRGRIDLGSWLLVAVTSLLSAGALLLWAFWTDNLGVGAVMLESFRGVPRWFLFLIGIPLFALLNAFAEEAIYRGVLFEALLRRFRNKVWLVLAVQASAFAAAHYLSGFPNGKLGYAMTFVYALMLGFVRLWSGGLLAPFVAHVAADLVIGYTLVLLAR